MGFASRSGPSRVGHTCNERPRSVNRSPPVGCDGAEKGKGGFLRGSWRKGMGAGNVIRARGSSEIGTFQPPARHGAVSSQSIGWSWNGPFETKPPCPILEGSGLRWEKRVANTGEVSTQARRWELVWKVHRQSVQRAFVKAASIKGGLVHFVTRSNRPRIPVISHDE